MLRLLRHHYPFRSVVFFAGEGVAILVALVAGVFLRLGSAEVILEAPYLFALKAGVLLLVCQGVLFLNDLYDFEVAQTPLGLLARILKATLIASVALAVVYYLMPQFLLGRGIFALSFALMAGVVFTWRLGYFWLVSAGAPGQNVLFVGSGDLAVEIAQEVLHRKVAGVRVVGFLTDDPEHVGERLLNPSVIGTYQELCRVVDKYGVDKVVVALQERRGFPVQELLACKMKGIQVVEGVTFFEQLTGKLMVASLRPSNLIFSVGFRKTRAGLLAKRAVDVLFSGVLLVVSAPFMLLAAMLIKLDSAGPVLFRQERVGERGQVFVINKFRSMCADAESASGPVWASQDDSRITRVGRWLRKFRLDELPQLWNVLKGDMSLVGPRPERPYFVRRLKEHIPYYDQRGGVKPGITGWAQVRFAYGSSEQDALEKLSYDLYYIKNYTVWLDLLILFETVKIVLFGRGSR